MMDKIILNDVIKSFGSKTVLNIPEFSISRGDTIAFLGTNGSGKTTLIKIICGLLYQTSGSVDVFGNDNRSSYVRQNTKFVFESGKGYYPYLTAYENIRYFLGLNKLKFNKIREELLDLVEYFNFSEHLYKKVSQLSQGNRQKMSLIINILQEPQVLALDEPTNGLDFIMCEYLAEKICKIARDKNMTILITTHDLRFVKQVKAKSYIMNKGRLLNKELNNQLWSIFEQKNYKLEVTYDVFNKIDPFLLQECKIDKKESVFIIATEKIKNRIIKDYDVISFNPLTMTLDDIYEKAVRDFDL